MFYEKKNYSGAGATPTQGTMPHYPPVPSPMAMPGTPAYGAPSPHPHSRSATPQMSPRGSHSQPGTPQIPTPGPTTPTGATPGHTTPTGPQQPGV